MIMLIARHNIIENSYDCGQVQTCPESDVLSKHGEIELRAVMIGTSFDLMGKVIN